MTRRINYVGFLAYIRHLHILPDELFMANLKQACTVAYWVPLLMLPLSFITYLFIPRMRVLPVALALCFVMGLVLFSVYLVYLKHKERKD